MGRETDETGHRRDLSDLREQGGRAGESPGRDPWPGMFGPPDVRPRGMELEREAAGEASDTLGALRRLGYPVQVRVLAARAGHHLAQAELITSAGEIFADVRRPTESELMVFRGAMEDAVEAGRGDLKLGLLVCWERRTGQRAEVAERTWPEPVAEAFAELTDDRARTRLEQKVERVFRDVDDPTPRDLEEFGKMVAGLRRRGDGDLERALVAEWERLHPEPRPWGDGADRLAECRAEGLRLVEVLEAGHPGVTGTAELVRRVRRQLDGPLHSMELGVAETTAARLLGLRENLAAVWAEWESAMEHSGRGPVEVARRFSYVDRETGKVDYVDVDVAADFGRLWVEVKNRRPFTTESSTWDDLQLQMRSLLQAAEQNTTRDCPRHLVVEFRRGVAPSVADALAQMGVEVQVGRRQLESGQKRAWEL